MQTAAKVRFPPSALCRCEAHCDPGASQLFRFRGAGTIPCAAAAIHLAHLKLEKPGIVDHLTPGATSISCHNALVKGYAVEGHVPVADIRCLLDERPEAIGLAVPGMPYGSPGMGPEAELEAYSVHLIRKDGTTEVFASYAA